MTNKQIKQMLTQDDKDILEDAIRSLRASLRRLTAATNDKEIKAVYDKKQNRLTEMSNKLARTQNLELPL